MRFLFVLSCSALLGLSAPPLAAATLVVDPVNGPVTSLQAAIAAAAPGDVIWVKGGSYSAVVLDKPLTIVGEPRARLLPAAPQTETIPFVQDPALVLQGPGAGRVTLVNLEIGGIWDGSWFSVGGKGIAGAGFSELHVHRCDVFGALPGFLTGSAESAQAIVVSGFTSIVVSGSKVTAGPSDTDFELAPTPDGRAGIDAPGATVIVLDATVRGGDVVTDLLAGLATPLPPNPCPCPTLTGDGGPGIVAARVFFAGSTVLGGAGSEVFDATGFPPTLIPWGAQPDGAPIVAATVVPLAQNLVSTGPLSLGGTTSLVWLTPGPGGLLFVSTAAAPLDLGVAGWWFLDAGGPLVVQPLPVGPGAATALVPDQPALLGLAPWFQAYHPSIGLTRPVAEVIVP